MRLHAKHTRPHYVAQTTKNKSEREQAREVIMPLVVHAPYINSGHETKKRKEERKRKEKKRRKKKRRR